MTFRTSTGVLPTVCSERLRLSGRSIHQRRQLAVMLIATCLLLAVIPGRAVGQTQSGAAILVYHRFGPTAGSTTVSDTTWTSNSAGSLPMHELHR
jgi:hypothetical protein